MLVAKYDMDDDNLDDPRTGIHSSIDPILFRAWRAGSIARAKRLQAEIDAAFERAKSDPALLARLNKPIGGNLSDD